jgi:3-methyl-2-oxobutanoate hydroxymethyltransferase
MTNKPLRPGEPARVTTDNIRRAKRRAAGVPLVMVTAYDFNSASVADASGVDIVLVGDSAAMTMLGYASTRQVSLDEMLMLAGAVRRGVARALVVGDLPFGTYENSNYQALETAARFVEAGCDAVKVEGGSPPRVERASALIAAGIPVMGHVGLTPQSTGVGEGFHVHGRTADAAIEILGEAKALEAAGCFAIVLEAVPATVTALLAPRISVPVIGIGAGAAADGQVLVFDDLVGLYGGHAPRFVKRYAEIRSAMQAAVTQYADDVRGRRFPTSDHEYGLEPAELERLRSRLGDI